MLVELLVVLGIVDHRQDAHLARVPLLHKNGGINVLFLREGEECCIAFQPLLGAQTFKRSRLARARSESVIFQEFPVIRVPL